MSSMKFLSTWLRNRVPAGWRRRWSLLNEVPEHMAQEWTSDTSPRARSTLLNEVPEHMAQEYLAEPFRVLDAAQSSMKFLSTWLRNFRYESNKALWTLVLNEVPEHMAQE